MIDSSYQLTVTAVCWLDQVDGNLTCSFKSYLTVEQETFCKARYLNIDFCESSCKMKRKELAILFYFNKSNVSILLEVFMFHRTLT